MVTDVKVRVKISRDEDKSKPKSLRGTMRLRVGEHAGMKDRRE